MVVVVFVLLELDLPIVNDFCDATPAAIEAEISPIPKTFALVETVTSFVLVIPAVSL